MTVAFEFDKVVVTSDGSVPYALESLRELQEKYELILHTCREDAELKNAEVYLRHRGIRLYSINGNPDMQTDKVYADIYIEPNAIGCPMKGEHVDWIQIMKLIKLKYDNYDGRS